MSLSLLWLRFALGCYLVGLVYAFVALTRTSELFGRVALHAASMGMVFHFVSLTELFLSGQIVWASVHNSESLLAFLSMAFFMVIYAIYHTTSPVEARHRAEQKGMGHIPEEIVDTDPEREGQIFEVADQE